RELLERHAAALPDAAFTRLRAPEIGLTMVRARIGNQGDRSRRWTSWRGAWTRRALSPAACSRA
ncbi:MAG TPA: hypothetical protein VIN75_12500, partial [Burkholderiaceae bacterium]